MDKLINHKNIWLPLALSFQVSALLMMMLDPEPHGFGILTLWIAPIVFFTGLALPFAYLIDPQFKNQLAHTFKNRFKWLGALLSFLIALIIYIITLEPTASLWDCSETIAAAYKLQVPHTPGTPLTLLFGRLFSMLALGNTQLVAWTINFMAALFSSLAVGLTYLIIWHFSEKLTTSNIIRSLGSIGGSLCLAFSDSFWFSAVEAETYGPSAFFMLLMIWLTMQGSKLKEGAKNRHIFLLSYLAGLSYCIHPMCILVLPVCFLVWRFGEKKWNWKGALIFFSLGVLCVLFISRVIAVHLFEWAFDIDLILVNQLSFPFYSGAILLALLVGFILWYLLKKYQQTRPFITAFLLILAGFTPYLMLFIRSAKQPPINEFSPNNLAKIKPYMNRESYPGRPLLYGPYYDAKITEINTKAQAYVIDGSSYEMVGSIPEYTYDKNRQTILPRMYSNDPAHMRTYQTWTGLSKNEKPRFSDNIQFMIKYQLGKMYMRYLFWNFAGRASDLQHAGWLKPWNGLPDRTSIGYNKASNQYFMLPFLMGLIGLIIQYRRSKSHFFTNLSFFAITGLLLAVYLNGTPNEPRERDYIYVGSFIAYSIWIGLGVIAMAHFISKTRLKHLSWILLVIPIWMLYQNYDDHNRANRTFQMDYAKSILDSCEEGAILFTGGDNDTFPLWYLQDVEGFRTDVRVKVLSYFNADWYINQLSRKYYDSPPFKLTLKNGENQYGPYETIYVQERTKAPLQWDKYMQALKEENPAIKLQSENGEMFLLPSKKLNINTSKGSLTLNVKGSYLPKNELAILDLIQSNNWERPIYFNFTSINSLRTDLKSFTVQEGQVYKLMPDKNVTDEIPLDKERSYENLISKMDYSNLQNSNVYFNHEDYVARMINPLRFNINELIRKHAINDEKEKVKELSSLAIKSLYGTHLEPSYANIQLASILISINESSLGKELLNHVYQYYMGRIRWQKSTGSTPSNNDIIVLQEAIKLLNDPNAINTFNELIRDLE